MTLLNSAPISNYYRSIYSSKSISSLPSN